MTPESEKKKQFFKKDEPSKATENLGSPMSALMKNAILNLTETYSWEQYEELCK